jgi:transcriptional regulator of arginine metabolism
MQKIDRLLAIEKIISEETIFSQEELLKRLKGVGISCTQATLSRNLRQLGVIRMPGEKGGYRYSLPDENRKQTLSEKGFNIVSVFRSLTEAKGMIVVKTIPGSASSAAYFIDNSGRFEIAGTIAGDDTFIIIPRDNIPISQVHSCLEMILPGLHEQIKGR